MTTTEVPLIIDCHAHGFPDKIAEKAVVQLEDHYGMKFRNPGTLAGLLASADAAGVSRLLVHTAVTKPSQTIVNNDWAASIQSDRVLPFGSMHPGFADIRGEFRRIRRFGLRGIKLHPDFQQFNLDDPAAFPIYDACGDDLLLMIHVGDAKFEYSSPTRMARVLDRFPRLKVILAHLGGWQRWDEARTTLYGRPVYIDTSVALAYMPPERAVELIRAHGADHVLFGSDYPYTTHREELARVAALGLTDAEQRMILGGNAARMLGGNY
ncbi:MAG TPA: amidohydrolase family protein [bacterium]|nr:amidohydrolase family protein [bacterium]